MDSARAALTRVASDVRPGQVEVVAEEVRSLGSTSSSWTAPFTVMVTRVLPLAAMLVPSDTGSAEALTYWVGTHRLGSGFAACRGYHACNCGARQATATGSIERAVIPIPTDQDR